MKFKTILSFLAILILCMFASNAFASKGGKAGSGALPWEGPIQLIEASLTGPVAISIALIAIMVAGAMLIFGGEINNFARTGVYITLVLGLLVVANNVLTSLYSSGANIPEKFKNPPASTINVGAINESK